MFRTENSFDLDLLPQNTAFVQGKIFLYTLKPRQHWNFKWTVQKLVIKKERVHSFTSHFFFFFSDENMWFLMTDFICHSFATINVFNVSDFHCHWTCFRTKRSATYIQVLRHLQIDLVEIIFIWCLKALSLEFWIYFWIKTEQKKKKKKKCLV